MITTTAATRQRRGLPAALQAVNNGRGPAAAGRPLRAADVLDALDARPDKPPRPDPWAALARARLAHGLERAREAELDRLRAEVSDLDRELRIARADIRDLKAQLEAARAAADARVAEAERRTRHEVLQGARHGGRLTSILAVSS